MNVLFEWTFGGIFHSGLEWACEGIFHPRSRGGDIRPDDTEKRIEEAIARAVDRIHSRLRLVPHYQARLRPAVSRSLEFIDETVEKIPGPLDMNSQTFGGDPRVNAMFASVDHLFDVCRESAELRAFYESGAGEQREGCCALVCMKIKERTVFGASLCGDMLRRDVRLTTVSFCDHRFYAPAASESEAREGLKYCLYGSLVERAFESISECKMSLRDFDAKRRVLGTRLRQIEFARKGAPDWASKARLEREAESVEQRIRDNERQLMQSPCLGPEECMDSLSEVLSNPERYMQLNHFLLRVDRMGIKVEEPSVRAEEIPLVEMELNSNDKRVVVLGRLPPIEFGARPDLVAAAGRYLGVV